MSFKSIIEPWLSDESSRLKIRQGLKNIGFDTTDWVRVVMYRRCFEFIRTLGPEKLDVLEIAAGPQWKRVFDFGSYTETQFPDFDICSEALDTQVALVISGQVFERLRLPATAGRDV